MGALILLAGAIYRSIRDALADQRSGTLQQIEATPNLPGREETLTGAEAVTAMPRPGCIRTHLPFNLTPHSEHAKYIYVARNPYDACVCFYAEALKNVSSGDECFKPFPEFFEQFVDGSAACGDYLANLLSWYERRFDYNVLFITYEELIEEHKVWVLRIADFIGVDEEYGEKLRGDRKLLEQICAGTCHEAMCENAAKNATIFVDEVAAIPEDRKPEWMKRLLKLESPERIAKHFASTAKPGEEAVSWKNLFTSDMIEAMQAKITAIHGSSEDVMTLWKSFE